MKHNLLIPLFITCCRNTPTFLEYFGHVFFFPGFLAGPVHFFTDYKAYIEGKSDGDVAVAVAVACLIIYSIRSPPLLVLGNSPTSGSYVAAIKKFFFAFVCMGINRLPGKNTHTHTHTHTYTHSLTHASL